MELGTPVRTHRVNNRRRAGLAVATLAGGLVMTPVGVFLVALSDTTSTLTDDAIPALLLGAGLGLLLVGGLLGWAAIRRRGEIFEVYENGLRHAYRGHERTVPWTRMTELRVDSHHNGRITVAGEKPLAFGALTEDAAELAAAVRRAVPDS